MIYLFNPLTLLLVYIIYTKTPTTSLFFKPIMYFGAVIDLVVNVTYFTVVFWELPREFLLTKRVERLKKTSGYKGNLARLLCKLMNHYQKSHCR